MDDWLEHFDRYEGLEAQAEVDESQGSHLAPKRRDVYRPSSTMSREHNGMM